MNGYKINGLTENAKNFPYIVAREVDDELWFYGAYENQERAEEVAEMVNGWTIENK